MNNAIISVLDTSFGIRVLKFSYCYIMSSWLHYDYIIYTFSWVLPRRQIVGSQSLHVFVFTRKSKLYSKVVVSLLSDQQWIRGSVLSQLCQHLVLSGLNFFAYIVVLICIYLIPNETTFLFTWLLTILVFSSSSVYSSHLNIFPLSCSFYLIVLKYFVRFHLFIFRERRREGESEGEKHQCERETLMGCFPHISHPGTEPANQARAWPRMEPVTLHFAGWCPTNWATLVRVILNYSLPFSWNLTCLSF